MKASDINMAEAYPESSGMSAAHRDPNEAGGADRYYRRPGRPNFAYRGVTFQEGVMAPEQIDAYLVGYHGGVSRAMAWKRSSACNVT